MEDDEQHNSLASIEQAENYLDCQVVPIMAISLRLWSMLKQTLEKVGFESRLSGFRTRESYLSIVGDGSKIRASLPDVYKMKCLLIDLQKERVLLDSPLLFKGLDRNLSVMLGELFSGFDQFHGFFDNPLHERGYEMLIQGELYLERFYWYRDFLQAFVNDAQQILKIIKNRTDEKI